MKITAVETLHADAGWRNFSFCKIVADNGLVGWSEYQEGFGSPGVTAAIQSLASQVVGEDARAPERIYWRLYAATRPAAGGVVGQAIGAIENALLDVKAKHYGVPVYELLGGAIRDRVRVYWSHCGTYRLQNPEVHDTPPLASLDDVRAQGREVREAGFTGLKTNVFLFDGEPRLWAPGFNMPGDRPDLNVERGTIMALKAQIEAFREGAGPDMDILLDLNFNFRTEGLLQIVDALDPYKLFWYEIDSYDAVALAEVRRASRTPIAGCETLIGLREFNPYFASRSVDVAIIDAVWNGVAQSMKIAATAEASEINIAPHNFYGHLCSMMNAHFAAAVPNLRIMEIDIDQVPWRDALFTYVPQFEDGHIVIPDTPGWGCEPDEAALAAHPPKAVRGITHRR